MRIEKGKVEKEGRIMKKTKNVISKTRTCLLVFGILFSQLSFPLSVLADEVRNEEEQEIVETSNQEEQTIKTDITNGRTLEETKENTETREPSSTEEQTPEQLNFTVELSSDDCIIRNTFKTSITLSQLKKKLENLVKVTDQNVAVQEDNEIKDETTILKTGNKVTLKNEDDTESTYNLLILGDYNDNGMIDEEDHESFINLLKMNSNEEILEEKLPIVDLNRDNVFNILDVTHSIFTDNTWELNKIANDKLENYLTPPEEVYTGEEFDVAYVINGFQLDILAGIQGKLNYNKDLVELTRAQVNGIEYNITEFENDNFIFLLDNYQQNGALITLTFKAKAIGTANIVIENIVASLGEVAANLDGNKVSTSVDILEYGKGGNVEEVKDNTTNNQTTPPISTENKPVSNPTTHTVVQATTLTTRPIALSGDNYIKSLMIEGYDIDFDKNTTSYSINVKNSVSSLNLTVILNDENATYYVEGNKDFKVGENTVNIVVKAENGSTRTYSIKVNKEKVESTEKEDEEEENIKENNTSKTIIIILIILVIIGLIYVIFKDDEEDEKESKK